MQNNNHNKRIFIDPSTERRHIDFKIFELQSIEAAEHLESIYISITGPTSVNNHLFDALKVFIQKPNKITEIVFTQNDVYDTVDDSVRDLYRVTKFMDLIKNPVFFDISLLKKQYDATEMNILSEYLARSTSINNLQLYSRFEVMLNLVEAINSNDSIETIWS